MIHSYEILFKLRKKGYKTKSVVKGNTDLNLAWGEVLAWILINKTNVLKSGPNSCGT